MALVDMFLKIEKIEGESTAKGHEKEIVLSEFSWGEENLAAFQSGGGMGSGKVKVSEFKVKKLIDKSSVTLMKACASGEHFPKATLTVRKAGKDQQDYYKVEFDNVFITDYSVRGDAMGDYSLPTDEFGMAFEKINFIYKEQKADGSVGGDVKGGWDVKHTVTV